MLDIYFQALNLILTQFDLRHDEDRRQLGFVLLQQLEVRAWLLEDADLLKQFASCLALGAEIPSFAPERVGDPSDAVLALAKKQFI